ncbi:TonB-dependent receptor [Phenylobacterium sp.]|uniref:TonB-dependent receptor domain-containing protein n=1 Tax=Phenylobacterium sp. TaxID=1871053 RepID=UPI0025F8313F|nr:TonB-dependent receptor [Phenylobacterium sp.]
MTAAVGLALPAGAHAAEVAFSIPDQPRELALLVLARQAGISLGFAPGARCDGRAGVSGRMSVDAALGRLLAGSACVARRPDARTVVIRPAPVAPASTSRPAPAPAAHPAEADLAELVVTADKTEQLLSQSASGLTAVGGAELARAGVADVRDLSLLAAGVTVTNLGPGRDKVILRGLSDGPLTGHTQSTVGLYLGDLRLTDNAPDPDLPLADVARVEVLRGPQGSLYGAGSIGGVLHIVPNAPDPSARAGSLSATLSATAHSAGSYELQGIFNQPFGDGDGAVRAVAWSEQSGGTIDDVGRGLKDVDRTRRVGVRATLLWRVAPDFDLDAVVMEQNIDTRDAHYADPAVGTLSRSSTIAQPHDNDFVAGALGARWSPSWGRLTLSLGALDHDVGTTYDATAAPMALVPAGARPRSFTDRNEIRALVAEGRAASAGPGRFQWKAGLFAAFGNQTLEGRLTTVEGPTGYEEARRDRLREAAAFGEVSYDLTPTLTATAGGRLFQSRLHTWSEVSLGAPVRTFRGSTRYNGFAPRFVLAYRPWPNVTLYAQAAEGYRTPGFNTSGPADQVFSETGGAQPLRRYAGDELWSYEAGGRWRSPALGLALRLAAFRADWTDIQADILLPSGLPFTANLGDGSSRGIEAEATWRRGPFEVAGNVVWQEPELRYPEAGLPARADTGLPGVPKLSYAASAAYNRPLAATWDLELRATFAYVGRSRLAFDAVTAPVMGGYGDLRLSAALSGTDLTARIFADNLLNRRGDTLAFGNPFLLRTTTLATPQRPRTVGVTLTRQF